MQPADGPTGVSVAPLERPGETAIFREWRLDGEGNRIAVLVVRPVAEHPPPSIFARLTHEYELRDELDGRWAVKPLELVGDGGGTMLVLEDRGGEPLERLLSTPIEVGHFLRLAIGIVSALDKLHARGLVHKDIKPANILVNDATGEAWLTGFGITSRLSRERQSPDPPEMIAGTLAYMAPEQTGRMNRSIDSRSDLYALGVTFYQMLTGVLPFEASDVMELIHCHIARWPVTPIERLSEIPNAVSAMIMKLLTKSAEHRFQTAAGVEHDLRRCLAQWDSQSRIDDFPLGEHDTPDRLLIPEKLYGRECEVEILRASFDRILKSGTSELVLVSGYSGIGKSSVVNELHKVLIPLRGFFASGKFDQYKRDIPYATLAQAFRGLICPILAKSEEELCRWRDTIREALGPNGQLMVDLVPELKVVLGEQPPVPELPPQETQRRVHQVICRFIGIFTRDHPLVLFLDDLQWLDAATLDLIEVLLTRRDVQHLMLIGAYRDNEVNGTHPLMQKLEAIRQAGVAVHDIVLAPLTRENLRQLVGDSLYCELDRAEPLAKLIHDKTAGNPFFALQFVSALAEESLLTFDYGQRQWSCDLNRIHARCYTDNVVDLMLGKLNRLPIETQKALQQLACLGNSAEFAMLEMVYRDSAEKMHGQLWEAVRAGLIFRSEDSYRFLHDRVQEAAYSLIPKGLRAEVHLRIGMLMASHLPQERLEEEIFEIVNQLNRGSQLVASIAERERIAELNLKAGKRAKHSSAYSSAIKFLRAGRSLLTDASWTHSHNLVFSIECLLAECEMLTAELAAAEQRLSMLAERAKTTHDFALVTRLRLPLYIALGRSDRAMEIFVEYQRSRGEDWPLHPTDEEVSREYDRIWTSLGTRQIEELFDLPLITNPDVLTVLDVFTEVPYFTDPKFLALAICRMVNLSLEHGNSDASCFAYVWLGMIAGSHFGNYQAGFRFGQLAYDLVEKRGLHRYRARTYLCFGNLIVPWTKHVKTGRQLVRRAFVVANRSGDVTFAAYSCNNLNTNLLATGDPLPEVQLEVETGLEFANNVPFGLVTDIITSQLGLIRTLRGLTRQFGSFDDQHFDESQFERRFSNDPTLAIAECWYWIRKLQARFFAGDYPSAVQASLNAKQLLWTSTSFFELAEYHFYSALSLAAPLASASDSGHFEALMGHQRQLAIWAEHCPENFEDRTALVGAEIARVEGREREAMDLYERAIRSAHANGFVHNEAIANELAGRFYAARGFEKVANVYRRDALCCFLRWGAHGKVGQLESLYPTLAAAEEHPRPETVHTAIEKLDVKTVVKASQAVSAEIEFAKLVDRLMTVALENAGANRGSLISPQENGGNLIEAVAEVADGEIVVSHEALPGSAAPESVIRYVVRTRESVILDDASRSDQFAGDEYLVRRQPRSIFCLPLVRQAAVVGVLYLENTLTSHVFTPERTALLSLLASQIAISLENTRLYNRVRERETKIRRLVEPSIVGIFVWQIEGRIIEANDAFLRLVGYDREDLALGRVHRGRLTPAEWWSRDEQAMIELKAAGTVQPFEKEYLQKDGSRVPVLVAWARLKDDGNEAVGFVLDLTARKRAEEALRQLEHDLTHMNRLSMMGELTASLAHEVTQPIAAARNNARAALNFMDRHPPDLGEIREALSGVISDADRARNIIDRIRDQVKKAPPRRLHFDLNETITEILVLARTAITKNGVSVQTSFAERLLPVHGDRVQLQQVVLNLILNAVEAMESVEAGTRELSISTEQDRASGVVVAVRDSGPGIDPEHLDRVFEAFYTTKANGVGMGLSICRSIIDAHGGRLWAEPNERRGAVFQFALPSLENELMVAHNSGSE
jgi:PAS domain S-box-containing protein